MMVPGPASAGAYTEGVLAQMFTKTALSIARRAGLVAAGVFVTTYCFAANFTADVVTKDGKNLTTSKIYVSDDKVRRETKLNGKDERVTIVRADKGVTWQLMPKDKTYLEMKSAKLVSPDPAELKKFSTEKLLGNEKIAGYMCKKYLYTPKEAGGASITVWMSEKLGWPLKVQVRHPGGVMSSEYNNIKEIKPKDALFELPYYYKELKPEEPKTVAPSAQSKE